MAGGLGLKKDCIPLRVPPVPRFRGPGRISPIAGSSHSRSCSMPQVLDFQTWETTKAGTPDAGEIRHRVHQVSGEGPGDPMNYRSLTAFCSPPNQA